MVTIKCKHSGIVFEAKTKRTKQHPDIAALKQRANKDGNYREVDNALDAVTKAGGYSTIEKYMQLVNDMVAKAIDAKRQASNKLAAERRAEQTRRHDAKNNATTIIHGYAKLVTNGVALSLSKAIMSMTIWTRTMSGG